MNSQELSGKLLLALIIAIGVAGSVYVKEYGLAAGLFTFGVLCK